MKSSENIINVAIDITPLQTEQKYRGVGRYVYNLISQLLKDKTLDKQIDLYLVKFAGVSDFDNYKKLIVISRENSKKELTKSLIEQKIQVYHCTEKLLPFKKKSFKIVLTHHDIIPYIFKTKCFVLNTTKQQIPELFYSFFDKNSIIVKALFILLKINKLENYII